MALPEYVDVLSQESEMQHNYTLESTNAERYIPKYPGLYTFSKEYFTYHGYIGAVVSAYGIAANLANIIVLTRKKMISSTNTILTWLAVADLMTMLSYLPVSIHFYIMKDPNLEFPSSRNLHWIRFMLFHINFTVVAHTVAIWLTIMLAMWRYFFISHPTGANIICTMKNAKTAILLIYMMSVIICIPNYMITSVQESYYNNKGLNFSSFVYYHFKDSQMTMKKPVLNKFNYWIQAFCIKLIPCVLLTIVTILLIMAMTKAYQRHMRLKPQDRSEHVREHHRTTAMLVIIVGLFLVSELSQGILTLCNIFIEKFYEDVYWPLGDLMDFMALFNNSINFLLFCTMSRHFRDTFVETFCVCWSNGPTHDLVNNVVSTNINDLDVDTNGEDV